MSKEIFVKKFCRRKKILKYIRCSGCLGTFVIVFFTFFTNNCLNAITIVNANMLEYDSTSDFCNGICVLPIILIVLVIGIIFVSRIMKKVKANRIELEKKQEYDTFVELEEKIKKDNQIIEDNFTILLEELKKKLNENVLNLNIDNLDNLKKEIEVEFNDLLKIQFGVLKNIDYLTVDPSDDELEEVAKGIIVRELFSDQLNDIKNDDYLDESELDYIEKLTQLLGFNFYIYFANDLQRLVHLTNIKNGDIDPIECDLSLKEEEIYLYGPIKVGNIVRNKLIFDKTESILYLTNENIIIQGIRTFSIKLDSIVSIKDRTNDLEYSDEDYDENGIIYNSNEEFINFKITYKPQSQYKELQFLATKAWSGVLQEFTNYFNNQ